MRKRLLSMLLLLTLLVGACPGASAWGKSSFSILFIDVGQGDSALVECDGHYMLIDGGPEGAGEKVRDVLKERQIQCLDILAISHNHEDHIGGLPEALQYAQKEILTISNSESGDSSAFLDLEKELGINGATITVPHRGDTYKLGSASVEVVDVSAEENNDSLVLLITYGKNRFLFTGDIEGKAQKRLTDYLSADSRVKRDILKVDLIKMPHHGAYNDAYGFQSSNLNRMFMLLDPEYAVISVGAGNRYKHPHEDTLKLLDQAETKVYRTDLNGNILVRSNGRKLTIETEK